MSYVNIKRAEKIIPKICEKNASFTKKIYNKIKAHHLINKIERRTTNDLKSLIKTSQIQKKAVESGNSFNRTYQSPKNLENIFNNYYYINNSAINRESKKLKNLISTPIYKEIKKLDRSLIISDETQKKLEKMELKENNSIYDPTYYKKLLNINKSFIDNYFNESINNVNEDISSYLEKMNNLCRNYRNLQKTTKNIKIRRSLLGEAKILRNKKKIQSPLTNCDLLNYIKCQNINKKYEDEEKKTINMKLLKRQNVVNFMKKNKILKNESINTKKYDNTAQVILNKVLKNRKMSAIMLKKKNKLNNLINESDLPTVDEYDKIIQNTKKQIFIKKINMQKKTKKLSNSSENLLQKFDYNLRYHTKTTTKEMRDLMNKLILEIKNEMKLKKEQDKKIDMENILNYDSNIENNKIINESKNDSICNTNRIFYTRIKTSKANEGDKKKYNLFRDPSSKVYRLNSKMSKSLIAQNYEEYLSNKI